MKRLLLLLLPIFVVTTARADDLPGVVAPEPIVKPMPDEDGQPVAQQDEAIRVGDWDVRVSGSVTVDIGAGSQGKPLR